jgi:enamine deaminase RidA (YjgF/YER057c/UK114 family)
VRALWFAPCGDGRAGQRDIEMIHSVQMVGVPLVPRPTTAHTTSSSAIGPASSILIRVSVPGELLPKQDHQWRVAAGSGGPPQSETASFPDVEAEARVQKLHIELPPVPPPVANFIRARQVGDLLFLSGHGPVRPDGSRVVGKLGVDIGVDEAKAAARLTGLNMLASARQHLGTLDRVKTVVKVLGMVNSGPGFDRQPEVMDGFSDLMVEVFGEEGRHTRSAVGMAELPFGIPVEVEMILEVT